MYDELRVLAHRELFAEAAGHTLNTTALLHEAYFRLVDDTRVTRLIDLPSPELWTRLERLFAGALDLDAAQRDAFLRDACDDVALRQQVFRLLHAISPTAELLDAAADGVLTIGELNALGSLRVGEACRADHYIVNSFAPAPIGDGTGHEWFTARGRLRDGGKFVVAFEETHVFAPTNEHVFAPAVSACTVLTPRPGSCRRADKGDPSPSTSRAMSSSRVSGEHIPQ